MVNNCQYCHYVYLEIEPHVPPRVAEDRECAAGATTGGACLLLLGSDSKGLDSCSTERDNEELSIDLENAFKGDKVGLQSFGVVAKQKNKNFLFTHKNYYFIIFKIHINYQITIII